MKPVAAILVVDDDDAFRGVLVAELERMHFRATGVRPKACERLKASGIHLPPDMFEGITEVR